MTLLARLLSTSRATLLESLYDEHPQTVQQLASRLQSTPGNARDILGDLKDLGAVRSWRLGRSKAGRPANLYELTHEASRLVGLSRQLEER